MAVNYAEKYSDVIDERFKQGALTDSVLNTQYEFDGVNKVNVYSIETVPLNDLTLMQRQTDTVSQRSWAMIFKV